jgi:hypothetical protein
MFLEFPKIQHLPWMPNLQHDDHTAEMADVENLLADENTIIQEKVDGANCAILWNNGVPKVRGRTRYITKGRIKNTPANEQFRPIWNWIYDNREKFEHLNDIIGGPVAVYGDWMLAQHGLIYDRLPSYFIAYEIFIPEKCIWVIDNDSLVESGFTVSPILHSGRIETVDRLIHICNMCSMFSTHKQEGIVVKTIRPKSKIVSHRYKMIREGFVQGALWNDSCIVRNKLYI